MTVFAENDISSPLSNIFLPNLMEVKFSQSLMPILVSTRSNFQSQNFAARVVLGLRKFDHISQGRKSLRWLDVTEKVLLNDLVLAFKCVNGLAPDYLVKYFVKRSAVHNRNTRGCNNFVVPRCRL